MRALTTILIILFCSTLTSQSFELTKDGLINTESSDKSYLVFEYPDLTNKEVYKNAMSAVYSIYKSPDEVISANVENEFIKLFGRESNRIRRNKMHVFDIDYNIELKFKDSKMRIEVTSFEMVTFTDKKQILLVRTNNSVFGDRLGIFNKDGKLKSKLAKQDIEDLFNGIVKNIISEMNTDSNEDW